MIFKLIIFLTLYSSAAYSCVVYNMDGSGSNLDVAKVIILGNIKRTNNEMHFISEKPWKNVKLKLSTAKCGGFMLRDGERLIFSSMKSLDELMKLESIDLLSGHFNSVDFFSRRVLMILDKIELPAGHPNYFWKYCSVGSTCIDVVGRCGERFGINKNSQENFENYLKKNKKYKCSKANAVKKSSCVNNFCS